MARGGARPGAGRPRLSDEEKAARALAKLAAKVAKPPREKQKQKKARPAKARTEEPEKPAEIPDPEELDASGMNALEFLQHLYRSSNRDMRTRMQAAALALPFEQPKPTAGGKKDERNRAAKVAGAGKFAPSAPPKLVAVNG